MNHEKHEEWRERTQATAPSWNKSTDPIAFDEWNNARLAVIPTCKPKDDPAFIAWREAMIAATPACKSKDDPAFIAWHEASIAVNPACKPKDHPAFTAWRETTVAGMPQTKDKNDPAYIAWREKSYAAYLERAASGMVNNTNGGAATLVRRVAALPPQHGLRGLEVPFFVLLLRAIGRQLSAELAPGELGASGIQVDLVAFAGATGAMPQAWTAIGGAADVAARVKLPVATGAPQMFFGPDFTLDCGKLQATLERTRTATPSAVGVPAFVGALAKMPTLVEASFSQCTASSPAVPLVLKLALLFVFDGADAARAQVTRFLDYQATSYAKLLSLVPEELKDGLDPTLLGTLDDAAIGALVAQACVLPELACVKDDFNASSSAANCVAHGGKEQRSDSLRRVDKIQVLSHTSAVPARAYDAPSASAHVFSVDVSCPYAKLVRFMVNDEKKKEGAPQTAIAAKFRELLCKLAYSKSALALFSPDCKVLAFYTVMPLEAVNAN